MNRQTRRFITGLILFLWAFFNVVISLNAIVQTAEIISWPVLGKTLWIITNIVIGILGVELVKESLIRE